MNSIAQNWRRVLGRRRPEVQSQKLALVSAPQQVDAPLVEIAPNDPILAFFQSAAGAVDLKALELDSPARTALRAAGVRLVVPLVSQGELIGVLSLGPRLSD
jgi:hypothetical protein